MRSDARPLDRMVGVARALRDPGRRGAKSIGAALRRLEREFETRVRVAKQAIEDGDDLEWHLFAYVQLCASWVFGVSTVEMLIDLAELEDPTLFAFMRAFPRDERDAVLDRFLEKASR